MTADTLAEKVQSPPSRARALRVLEPPHGIAGLRFRELWDYRELLYFLTARDLKVRYKQSFFGVAWAALQPLLFMAVFVLFIGRISGVKPSGVPYVLFALAGLVTWTFFASALASSSNSLVLNERLVSKVYFPRLLMPLAAAASFLLDFAIGSVLLLVLMALHSWDFSATILLAPVFALLDLVTALAIGVWLSAINVRYRDVVFAVPFFVQVWLFVTPVAYALTIVPSRWRALYGLNPMASVVEGYRWAMLGTPFPPTGMVAVSVVTVAVLLSTGLLYFKRAERTFADVI